MANSLSDFLADGEATAPMFFAEDAGAWVVTDYHHARQVLTAADEFVVTRNWLNWSFYHDEASVHQNHRRKLNALFAPNRIERLAHDVTRLISGHFEKFAPIGEFVTNVARPSAIQVALMAIGINPAAYDGEKEWLLPAVDVLGSLDAFTQSMVTTRLTDFFRRAANNPAWVRDDAIVHHSMDKSDENLCLLIFGAGVITASHQLANIPWRFATGETSWRHVKQDPGKWHALIEELLRLDSALAWVLRTAANDLELGGHPIKAGARVLVGIRNANRDADAFAAPTAISPDRHTRHLAFGFGAHHCIGAALARLQMRALMAAMMPWDDIAISGETERAPTWFHHGFRRLPLRFAISDTQ